MGGEWTQFAYSKATFAAETLKCGIQAIVASRTAASAHVHSASIHQTPTTAKASCGQWGILTTKIRQACLHPATVAMSVMTPGGGHRTAYTH